jgi:pyruvate/2-oxoglutarate/acetoin dehydrogenase E1 component
MRVYDSIQNALKDAHQNGVTLLGEINSYRFPGWGMEDFPVCESLMNAVGVGLALSGRPVIVSHDRMDFITCGIDPIINFAALRDKIGDIPLVIRMMVGYGRGQGPQHAKDLTHFFNGLRVYDPLPAHAGEKLKEAIDSGRMCIYVERRINYDVWL